MASCLTRALPRRPRRPSPPRGRRRATRRSAGSARLPGAVTAPACAAAAHRRHRRSPAPRRSAAWPARRWSTAAAASVRRRRRRCGAGSAGAVAHPAGDVAQGREVAQLEVVVAFELVVLAHGGEHFGLLDGVDAEVGFEVEVGVQQVGGVAGHLGDDRRSRVASRRPRSPAALRPRRLAPPRVRRGGGRARSAGAAPRPARWRTQPATWRRVGKSRSLQVRRRVRAGSARARRRTLRPA